MWPFSKRKQPEDTSETLLRFDKRISRLEEEWTDVYGRFRRLQMRTAKQVQRLESSPEEGGPQPVESADDQQGTPLALSARQREVQLQVLARRNRKGVA